MSGRSSLLQFKTNFFFFPSVCVWAGMVFKALCRMLDKVLTLISTEGLLCMPCSPHSNTTPFVAVCCDVAGVLTGVTCGPLQSCGAAHHQLFLLWQFAPLLNPTWQQCPALLFFQSCLSFSPGALGSLHIILLNFKNLKGPTNFRRALLSVSWIRGFC